MNYIQSQVLQPQGLANVEPYNSSEVMYSDAPLDGPGGRLPSMAAVMQAYAMTLKLRAGLENKQPAHPSANNVSSHQFSPL